MDLKTHIGLKVRTARLEKRLTQEQFAERLGKAVETVSNIERGEALTGLETLQKIAAITDKTMASFLEGIDLDRQVPRQRLLAEEELRLQASALSDVDLSLAVALLKAWVKERGGE